METITYLEEMAWDIVYSVRHTALDDALHIAELYLIARQDRFSEIQEFFFDYSSAIDGNPVVAFGWKYCKDSEFKKNVDSAYKHKSCCAFGGGERGD